MGNSAAKGLPYTAGAAVPGLRHASVWHTVCEGSGVSDPAQRVVLFRHDKRAAGAGGGAGGAMSRDTDLAVNALKRLRMLRHPYILKFVVRGGAATRVPTSTRHRGRAQRGR
jgi:hypothetical protein